MPETTPNSSGAPSDWLTAVQHHHQNEGDVLEFAELQPGDHLQVMTRHTLYDFAWQEGDEGDAYLRTNREDRVEGSVRLVGCCYGAGSTIAPNRLFNGGTLEYTSQGGCKIHRTTAIAWIRLVRHCSP